MQLESQLLQILRLAALAGRAEEFVPVGETWVDQEG